MMEDDLTLKVKIDEKSLETAKKQFKEIEKPYHDQMLISIICLIVGFLGGAVIAAYL